MESPTNRSTWLVGPAAPCDPVTHGPRAFRLVLLGPPGVGKGTQAALLAARLGACHLSTGDIFRAARGLPECNRTPALNAALAAMQRGELVSDDIVLDLVRERVECLRCNGGFLFDGFPRTVRQAEALDELLKAERVALDAVVSYELPIERIVTRIGGRRVCPQCRAVYHVEAQPPRVDGVCDQCGASLAQRDDDRPDAVRVRMQAYEKATRPLMDYYRARALLRVIEAEGSPEAILARTLDALDAATRVSLATAPQVTRVE